MIRKALLICLIGIVCARLSQAAPRFPVTLASVAAALAAQQPQLAASSLQIPAVTASTPNPDLLVQSIAAGSEHTARVRMACRSLAECLPFLVTVHGSGAMPAEPGASTQSRLLRETPAAAPGLRAGTRALLVIDSGRLHITLPVIALAGGRVGIEVKVASLDRRVSYMARVVSPTEVRGSL